MQYELQDSLGLLDARKCNELGAALSLDKQSLSKGASVDLSADAAKYLGKKYPALVKPVGKVKGEAKTAEITAPAK